MSNAYLPGVDAAVIRLGLSRVRELLEELGNPQNRLRYVHVAGTNGKGSVSACIASILKAAGYRTGLFTSPGLESFRERIQMDGRPISREELREVSALVRPKAERMADKPTEFEISTALALCWFARQGCDIAVLEVGMGGAEDATNVIPAPEAAVFAAMGLDHTGLLGNTLTQIASVKAGILKPGAAAVSYGNDPEAERVFSQVCRRLGAPYETMRPGRISGLEVSLEGCRFTLEPYGAVRLPLIGAYQPQNALLAVTAVETLRKKGWRIPDCAIVEGLETVVWPGRFELLRKNPRFFLDGSHNPQGIAATVESIRRVLGEEKPVILMGVMADKDVARMLELLLPAARRFVTVTPSNPRALGAEELARRIRAGGGRAEPCATVAQGVRRAIRLAGEGGAVCALGTLYFSAEVRHAVLPQAMDSEVL